MDTAQIPPSEKYLYDYNLGRAFDLSGQPADAYPCYVNALKAQPRFTPASERAFDNLRRSGGPNKIDEALSLADRLVKAARSDIASREILQCLDAWGDNDQVEAALSIPVRHLTTTCVEPERFLMEYWPALDQLGNRRPHLRRGTSEILTAFKGDLKPAIQAPRSGSPQFAEWSQLETNTAEEEKVFPKLLVMIGNHYYGSSESSGRARDPIKALALYAAAWSLNRHDTESALFTAGVLRDYVAQLDRDRQFYDAFVDAVIVGKSGLYSKVSKTPADWANLVRMHFLLGSIFASSRVWGLEDNRRSPYSNGTMQSPRRTECASSTRSIRLSPDFTNI